MRNKINILGVRIDNLTMAQVLDRVEFFLNSPHQYYAVTPNSEFIVTAQKDAEFKDILNKADLAPPDGFGLLLAAPALRKRIHGVDLVEEICGVSAKNGRKIFLLGARGGAAEKALQNLKQKYPRLNGKAWENHEDCASAILNFQPEILFVALGHPKQEKWIYENLKRFPSVKIAMGVGGAFDFLSGKVRRAPLVMRKLGLEWLWRLMIEPKRAKRIFNAVIVFPWLVARSRIKKQEA